MVSLNSRVSAMSTPFFVSRSVRPSDAGSRPTALVLRRRPGVALEVIVGELDGRAGMLYSLKNATCLVTNTFVPVLSRPPLNDEGGRAG